MHCFLSSGIFSRQYLFFLSTFIDKTGFMLFFGISSLYGRGVLNQAPVKAPTDKIDAAVIPATPLIILDFRPSFS